MNQGASGAPRKTFLALLGAALLFIVVQVSEELGQGYGKGLWNKLTGADKDPIVETVRKTAARINREAPVMLDSATRLDGAIQATDSMRLILLHTLMLWRARDITEQQVQDALAAKIKAAACGKDDQVKLLKSGLTLVFRYRSRDGMFVADIPVSQADCEGRDALREGEPSQWPLRRPPHRTTDPPSPPARPVQASAPATP